MRNRTKKPHQQRVQSRKAKSNRQSASNNPMLSWRDWDWPRFRGDLVSRADFEAAKTFIKLEVAEKVAASRKIIQQSIIDAAVKPDIRLTLAIAESENLLPGYATLDDLHRAEIGKLINEISRYLSDTTRKRPLNCLMLAAPGAGKSTFINQLARSMTDKSVQAVTFNMATMQSHDDIAQPIDELRNLKVNDRFPLLFLDEFDSDPSRYPALLPLLWDGELHIGHRDLKLGRAVIVLAGSNPDLPKVMDQSAKMQLDSEFVVEGFRGAGKLVDLLSRVNGGIITIPDLDLRSENRDRRVDKVCVSVALLRRRFGRTLAQIPRAILRFIAHTRFRYGVRSIAHLIDAVDAGAPRIESLEAKMLSRPFATEESLRNSSLKLHLLDKDEAFGIVNRWKEFTADKAVVSVEQTLMPSPFLGR